MPFYHITNILQTELILGEQPWEHTCSCEIPPEALTDKDARQVWYRLATTKHYFYTGIEPQVPTRRPGDKNPPFRMHAFIADYDDLQLPKDVVLRAAAKMPIKPTWLEQSLGGNWRLIWELKEPLMVGGDRKFCTFMMKAAAPWLQVNRIDGCDMKAFETFSRMFCFGKPWERLPYEKISVEEAQGFIFQCAKKYNRFESSAEEECIPLEEVEAALKEKFGAKFNWPGPFVLDSQGPSFWVEGSTSPMSAIVKKNGMFTFAGHATQSHYSWGHSDLLGEAFVRENLNARITAATRDIYVGPNESYYIRLESGRWRHFSYRELLTRMRTVARLSGEKQKGTTSSMIDQAMNFIKNNNSVDEVGPCVFARPGVMAIPNSDRRMLNIYDRHPVEPATGKQTFGPQGKFPFLSLAVSELFKMDEQQLPHYLAWSGHAFRCAVEWTPKPSTAALFAGGPSTGKTLFNRHVMGLALGGFADGSRMLLHGAQFTSMELEHPLIVLDDDAVSSFDNEQQATAALKKLVGNQESRYEKKFQNSLMVQYMGRVGITLNLDYRTTCLIGCFDSYLLDKVSLFRCIDKHDVLVFPDRLELQKIISEELPYYVRYCIDYEPPDFVLRDGRWGYAAFHNDTLLKETKQSSRVAPFLEMLIRTLHNFFQTEPDSQIFRGTQTEIYNQMRQFDTGLLRYMRDVQFNMRLEQVYREKLLKCHYETGSFNTRVWCFERFDVKEVLPGSTVNLGAPAGGLYGL